MKHTGSALVLAALLAGAAHADTLILEPAADATLFQVPDGDPEVADSLGPHLFVGRIRTGPRRRALLRFDLSALPAGASLVSASLQVQVSRTISGVLATRLHRVTTPWQEGIANAGTPGGQGVAPGSNDPTWSLSAFPGTPWVTAGGDYAETASASFNLDGEAPVVISDPTMLVDLQSWQSDPAGNFGWILIGDESQSPPTAKRLESGEADDPSTRPQLVIEYSAADPDRPIPVNARLAQLLLLLGVLGLAGRAVFRFDAR